MDQVISSEIYSNGKHTDENLTTREGIVLIPQPSDDTNNPLNWKLSRKIRIFAVIIFTAYSCTAAAASGQTVYPVQAQVYHKSRTVLSYTASAQVGGLALAPLILAPLVYIFGKSSMLFWTVLGALGCSIWGATRTHEDDFQSFLASRVMAGAFASLSGILGSSFIMDMFFLHQRGRAFSIYGIIPAMGNLIGSTFGAFIAGRQRWVISFWWTTPLLGIAAIIVFLTLEETSRNREEPQKQKSSSRGYVVNRIATFLPGTQVVPRSSASKIIKHTLAPILIGLSPAVTIIAFFILILFGWGLTIDILQAKFLQAPVAEGGYDFTTTQNGYFSFSFWLSWVAAELFGYAFNDRLPLWICGRFKHDSWSPELRLNALWMPILIMPIGLGLFGASLQYHLHYMILAVGVFLQSFGALLAQSITLNYAVECFTHMASEVTIIITLFRLAFGVSIPFFIDQWEDKVGIGWLFGTTAFITIFMASFPALLIWKGDVIRRMSLVSGLPSSEAGIKIK